MEMSGLGLGLVLQIGEELLEGIREEQSRRRAAHSPFALGPRRTLSDRGNVLETCPEICGIVKYSKDATDKMNFSKYKKQWNVIYNIMKAQRHTQLHG
eukprot:1393824-Amorphochlora_amoeboformis.AAC.1